ncbi:hypothetical protein [Aeromonas caviae]|uniref:hypothetical protein n=2 Tax=Aeromonas TaxID=642 RepID=UPI000D6899B6|nr:hypothetical protein [Aeromonas caviae]
MGRRYYRRRNQSLIADTASTMLMSSWWGALLLGLIGFGLFYWLLPAWIISKIQELPKLTTGIDIRTMVFQAVARRLHWSEFIGMALLWLGLLISSLKLLATELEPSQHHSGLLGFLARLLARWSD